MKCFGRKQAFNLTEKTVVCSLYKRKLICVRTKGILFCFDPDYWRGFEPITTYSAHWLKDARFAEAIKQFVAKKQKAVQLYKQDATSYLLFKQES